MKRGMRNGVLATAALLLASAGASAQYNVPQFNRSVANFEWNSVLLDVGAMPSGTYSVASVTFNWQNNSGSTALNSDAVWVLSDLAINDGTGLPPFAFIYANRGTAPNAPGSTNPATLTWPPALLDFSYTAGGTLYFAYRQRVAPANTQWNNIAIQFAVALPPPPPPSNDDCSGAIAIGSVPYLSGAIDISGGSNTTTGDPTFGCAAGAVRRTIWFKYTPTETRDYVISTCGADAPQGSVADTVMGIYTGACGALTPVQCDDSACGARAAVTRSLTAGTEYTIVIGRAGTDETIPATDNKIQLALYPVGTPPTGAVNDECTNAIVIPGASTSYLSDPIDLTDATITTDAPNVTCTTNISRTIWWTFTPTQTGDYTFATCTADAPQVTIPDTYIGMYQGTCGTMTQIACNDDGCDTYHSSFRVRLNAGTQYFLKGAKYGTGAPLTGEGVFQFKMKDFTAPPPPPVCAVPEVEPNDSKGVATAATLNDGQAVCGATGSDFDYFLVKVSNNPGIMRRRLIISTTGTNPTVTLRGLGQTAGVPNTTENELQLAGAAGYVQWYTLGNSADANDRKIYVRATGGSGTYGLTLQSQAVVPTDISGGPFQPGSITINTVGQTGGTQNDTDLWVYDSNFNPIATFGNDDHFNGATLGSTLTRTFAAGTYYIGMTRYNQANNLGSPADDDFRTGYVTDFPGVVVQGVVTPTAGMNVGFSVTDSAGARTVPATIDAIGDIAWFKMQVGTPVVTLGCQPADIANDQGTALIDPNRNPNVPNGGVNEGDYNCFFSGFFDAAAQCNIADDQGTPLPPFGTGGTGGVPNGGVNEGDYNCFFQRFFDGCPA